MGLLSDVGHGIGKGLKYLGNNFDRNAGGAVPGILGADYTPDMKRIARSNAISNMGAMLASNGQTPYGLLQQHSQNALLEAGLQGRQLRLARAQAAERQSVMQDIFGGGQGAPAAGGPDDNALAPPPAALPPAGPPTAAMPPIAPPGAPPTVPPAAPDMATDQKAVAGGARDPLGHWALAQKHEDAADRYTNFANNLLRGSLKTGDDKMAAQAKIYFELADRSRAKADAFRPKPFGEPKMMMVKRGDKFEPALLTRYTDNSLQFNFDVKEPSKFKMVDTGGKLVPMDENATEAPAPIEKTATPGEAETGRHNSVTEVETGRHNKVSETIERQKANAQAAAKPSTEADDKVIAQALANGELVRIRDMASLRGDRREHIFALAKGMNPKFDPALTDRRIKMEDQFTNSKDAANLQSFGTFLEHGGAASEAVNGIRNTNIKLINRPLNWWRDNMSSSPEYQHLLGSLEPVKAEYMTFLQNGHALTEHDKKAGDVLLNPASSPAAIQEALKTMGHTVGARYNETAHRYKQNMGTDLHVMHPLSDEARAGAIKLGIEIRGAGPAPGSSAPAATHRFDPATGRIEAVRAQ